MSDILNTLYTTLKDGTAEYNASSERLNKIQDKINSGVFTKEYIASDLNPQLDAAVVTEKKAREAVKNKAYKVIDEKITAMKREDQLNSQDITEDIKILNAGIKLNSSDITALLENNANNRTMTQIILRYAAEHDIDVNANYISNAAEINKLEAYKANLIDKYCEWLGKQEANLILDKYFGKA